MPSRDSQRPIVNNPANVGGSFKLTGVSFTKDPIVMQPVDKSPLVLNSDWSQLNSRLQGGIQSALVTSLTRGITGRMAVSIIKCQSLVQPSSVSLHSMPVHTYCSITVDGVLRGRTTIASSSTASFHWNETFNLEFHDACDMSFSLYDCSQPQTQQPPLWRGSLALQHLFGKEDCSRRIDLTLQPSGILEVDMHWRRPSDSHHGDKTSYTANCLPVKGEY